jgi:hypothetical protein
MLSHIRSLLEGGYIMIDKRLEKLLLALHTCVDREGGVDKTARSDENTL